MTDIEDLPVQVAVRIRPTSDSLLYTTVCTANEQKLTISNGKVFTFDYVFDTFIDQSDIYTSAVDRLVEKFLEGYNATILAYGQTGSGKTFTMGTAFEANRDFKGIIPRAVLDIFSRLKENEENLNQFNVDVQFLEIYREKIYDLLSTDPKRKTYDIVSDQSGGVCVPSATIKQLNGPADAIRFLQQGMLNRTVGATEMNAQSSRSHAIFTLMIRRQHVIKTQNCNAVKSAGVTYTSKFNFVDLAGSESVQEANGLRYQEGIKINKGLLQLGNVIFELATKAAHVSYRNSKLTRMLQDSIGGNSVTLLIACISPRPENRAETLRTLEYVHRARKIRNRLHLNQEDTSAELPNALFAEEIATLRDDNAALTSENGLLREENGLLREENGLLREEIVTMRNEIVKLRGDISLRQDDNASLLEQIGTSLREEVASVREENVKLQIKNIDTDINTENIDAGHTYMSNVDSSSRLTEECEERNTVSQKHVDADASSEGACGTTFDVERILKHHEDEDEGGYVFRVKWENYDSSFNEWIPEKNFAHGNSVLAAYKQKHKLRAVPQ